MFFYLLNAYEFLTSFTGVHLEQFSQAPFFLISKCNLIGMPLQKNGEDNKENTQAL